MLTLRQEHRQDLFPCRGVAGNSRRIHQRIKTDLGGRFLLPSGTEHPCRVIDISVGGIAVTANVKVMAGERIIFYLDQVGRVEGVVVRVMPERFAIQFVMTGRQLDRLADHLTWLVNRQHLGKAEQRFHRRSVPANPLSVMTLEDGSGGEVTLLDASLGGASVKSRMRPELESIVRLGDLRAKVIRYHDEGFAVAFLDIQRHALTLG